MFGKYNNAFFFVTVTKYLVFEIFFPRIKKIYIIRLLTFYIDVIEF